jgi:hypothetical protein
MSKDLPGIYCYLFICCLVLLCPKELAATSYFFGVNDKGIYYRSVDLSLFSYAVKDHGDGFIGFRTITIKHIQEPAAVGIYHSWVGWALMGGFEAAVGVEFSNDDSRSVVSRFLFYWFMFPLEIAPGYRMYPDSDRNEFIIRAEAGFGFPFCIFNPPGAFD